MERLGGVAKVKFPPIPKAAEDLLDVYLDLGPCHSNGIGSSKHPYGEIALAAPWMDEKERRLVRDMSGAYLDGIKRGEDPFGIPPFTG